MNCRAAAVVTFGLVHGSQHGAWCWERLTPELVARGHDVVAVDLPCDDPEATIATYAACVVDALGGAEEPGPERPGAEGARSGEVVLVGHSLGSLTIPVVATMRPVRHLIFLCSVPTGPGPAIDAELASMVTPEFAAAGRVVDAAGRESLADADAIRGLVRRLLRRGRGLGGGPAAAAEPAPARGAEPTGGVARRPVHGRARARRPLREPRLGRTRRDRAPRSTTGADARRPLAVPEPARRARGPARRGRDRLTADQHAQIGRRYQDGQRGFSISKPTGVPQWLRYETSCTGRRAATPHFPVG